MEIRREKKFYGFRWQDADEYLALVILEDGTRLLAHEDGYAVDPAGAKYYHVAREVEYTPEKLDAPWLEEDADPNPAPATMLEDLGWTKDAKAPMVYPLGSDEAVESTKI